MRQSVLVPNGELSRLRLQTVEKSCFNSQKDDYYLNYCTSRSDRIEEPVSPSEPITIANRQQTRLCVEEKCFQAQVAARLLKKTLLQQF